MNWHVFLQMTRGGRETSVCLHKFSLSNNYMSSLRTTACDALIVPSGFGNNEKNLRK